MTVLKFCQAIWNVEKQFSINTLFRQEFDAWEWTTLHSALEKHHILITVQLCYFRLVSNYFTLTCTLHTIEWKLILFFLILLNFCHSLFLSFQYSRLFFLNSLLSFLLFRSKLSYILYNLLINMSLLFAYF